MDFCFYLVIYLHLHEIHSSNFKNPQRVGFFFNCMLIVLLIKKKEEKKAGTETFSSKHFFFNVRGTICIN